MFHDGFTMLTVMMPDRVDTSYMILPTNNGPPVEGRWWSTNPVRGVLNSFSRNQETLRSKSSVNHTSSIGRKVPEDYPYILIEIVI
jgi:hypothetical protein